MSLNEEIVSVRRLNSTCSNQLSFESFIQNRYDLLGKNYFYIQVVTNKKTYIIPAHRKFFKIYLGVYLKDFPFDLLKLCKEIFSTFWCLKKIYISNILTRVGHIESGKNFSIDFLVDGEGYEYFLSKKLLSNLKYYKRKLIHDLDIELIKFDSVPIEYVAQYLIWKKETHGFIFKGSPESFLRGHQINGCYVLFSKAQKRLIAILFINKLNKIVFLENFSYDQSFSKYSPGKVLLYEVIQQLYLDGVSLFNLGGGSDKSYKAEFSNKAVDVYSGFVTLKDLI